MAIILGVIASTSAFGQTSYTWTSPTTGGTWTNPTSQWTMLSGSGTTFPGDGGSTGDSATLGNVTSGTRIVNLGGGTGGSNLTVTNLTIAGLTFAQTTAGAINELQLVGGGFAANHTATTTLTVTGTPLALGGSGVTGEELLYLNAAQSAQNGANTSFGNVVYAGNILIGTNGVLEMSAYSNALTPSVTGTVEVGSGGIVNIDQAISSFNGAMFAGTLQLDNGSVVNLGTTNSGSITAAGTGVRLTVNGNFLASTGSAINVTGTLNSSTNAYQLIFSGGTGSSATFQSGVIGSFFTNYTNAAEQVVLAGTGTSFTLASDVNLPQLYLSPAAITSSIVNFTIGSVSLPTLTMNGLAIEAPQTASGVYNGTLEITLSSNVSLGTSNITKVKLGSAGQTFIINTGGYTFDESGYGVFTTSDVNSAATNWTFEGGGTIKGTTINLSANTGANGTSVVGTTTLWASGTSGTSTLSNTAGGSIDPTSIFKYATTASGTESLISTRNIGRILVGDGSAIASTLQLGGNITSTGDATINAHSTLLLNGYNLTQSGTSTSNSGGLNGAGTVANNAASTTSTLTLDTSYGNGSFSGVIKDSTGASGTIVVVKAGTGSQTLSGTNTYTGTTTINGGSLILASTGNIASSATTINSGGTLSGSGKAGALTLNSGGFIAPAMSGTDTTSNLKATTLAWNSGGSLAFNLDGSSLSSTELTLSGSLTVGTGTLTINLTDSSALATAGTYDLVNFNGTNATSISQFTLAGSLDYAPGFTGSLVLDTIHNQLDFEVIAVPEPGTWALMLGGLALLVVVQRRRRGDFPGTFGQDSRE